MQLQHHKPCLLERHTQQLQLPQLQPKDASVLDDVGKAVVKGSYVGLLFTTGSSRPWVAATAVVEDPNPRGKAVLDVVNK